MRRAGRAARGALGACARRARARPAFAAGLFLVGMVVAIGAVVSLVVQFSDLLSDSIVYLTTEMPTFGYSAAGGEEAGNSAFEKYSQLRAVWGPLMLAALAVAAVSSVYERAGLVSPGAASRIFSKAAVMLFFFTFFPYVWDAAAGSVESLAVWILAPAGPEYANEPSEYILSKVSGVAYTCIDRIKPDHFAGLNSPWDALVDTAGPGGEAGELSDRCPVEHANHPDKRPISDTLVDVFLSLFRGIFVLTVASTMFIVGTGRIVLTGVFIIIIPVTEMLGLVPFFERLALKVRDMLVALLLLPVFSSLAIAGGAAYLAEFTCESPSSPPECVPPNPLHSWFVALTVLALVAFMPTIVLPQLSTFARSVTQMGSLAAYYGASATMELGSRALHGASAAGRAGLSAWRPGYAAREGLGSWAGSGGDRA